MTDTFYIRDPILEGIAYSDHEKALINSPLVQRLKWVSQLSMVNQVYNGGTHSRFSHSLGAMTVAGQYMTHLLETVTDAEFQAHGIFMDADSRKGWIQLARMAGLLHDIGHGPFSHSFDHAVYQQIYGVEDGGHDIARLKLLDSPLLYEHLWDLDVDVEHLMEIWSPGYKNNSFHEIPHRHMYAIIRTIVEGPLGADRIDFTRRDAYYVGMQHLGTVPASRIIQNSKIVFGGPGIGDDVPHVSYSHKCIHDIIRTLDGRLNMYESVYMHRTSMAATVLVEMMMRLTCEPFNLIQMTSDPEQFKRLTDHKFLGMVAESGPHIPGWEKYQHNIERAKLLYDMLMDRRLPKMDHETHVTDFDTPFNAGDYAAKWYPGRDPDTYQIVKTRAISGISADKFDRYQITFHSGSQDLRTCHEVLKEIGYQVPIKPYYIVRGYSFDF